MAQPTPYTRQAAFANFESNNPGDPPSGSDLDNEFDHLKTTTDELCTNLGLIQSDDGRLRRNSVGADQLKAEISIGFNEPTDWATATSYLVNDYVWHSNVLYRCLVAHTSGTFSTDLAALDWVAILDLATPLSAASTSATTAATSATSAASSATSASTSASAASTSASAAASSATSAAASATSAAASAGAFNGAPVDVASATTTDIGAAGSANVRITGTTTITALGTITAGTTVECKFAGALTLTYNATSLILPGAASIVTAANDFARFMSLGSGNWICTKYQRAAAGSLAALTAGTGNNNIVQLDGSAKLPAVDGSALTGISAPGLVLLGSATGATSASIDFTSLIDSTYNEYVFELVDILPDNDNTSLNVRVRTSGSFQSGSNYLSNAFTGNCTTSTITGNNQNGATSIRVMTVIGNAATDGVSGQVRLYGPATSGTYKKLTFDLTAYKASATATQSHWQGGGMWVGDTNAITGLQFFAGTGNLTGTIRLYGVKKS